MTPPRIGRFTPPSPAVLLQPTTSLVRHVDCDGDCLVSYAEATSQEVKGGAGRNTHGGRCSSNVEMKPLVYYFHLGICSSPQQEQPTIIALYATLNTVTAYIAPTTDSTALVDIFDLNRTHIPSNSSSPNHPSISRIPTALCTAAHNEGLFVIELVSRLRDRTLYPCMLCCDLE